MRKIATLITITLILMIILAAVGCGDGESATPTPVPTSAPTATTQPTPEPSLAPTPTATPAPTPTKIPQQTAPQLTHCRFFGTVQFNGVDVPADTQIQAIIDGEVVAETDTIIGTQAEFAGRSYYSLRVPESAEGPQYDGITVSFTIGGNSADQTGIWTFGENVRVDLTSSSS